MVISPVKWLIPLFVLVIASSPLLGQGAGVVTGSIVDAQSEAPLPGASVALEPRAGGAVRTARTDAEGRYGFSGVAAGEYRLRVQRLGYQAGEVEVRLQGDASASVSLGLQVRPVRLQPVEARGSVPPPPANPFSARDGGGTSAGEARVEAERLRQRTYLDPDVRLLTRADVDEAVTLAESDLFRSLQRLPGVSARDDYSAELWTRGGAWDHTRVYFDGLPLFNPVHSSGLFSGPNTEAVGSAVLYPGAQPLATGGGAAAALDVRSRRGGEGGPFAATGELSLASARLALDGAAGRHAWMVAARGSHTTALTGRVERRSRDEEVWTTRRFADVAARYDLRLGARSGLEASALWQRDALRAGPLADWRGETRPRWGSLAARATLRAPLGRLDGRVTAGASGFGAAVGDGAESVPREGGLISWPTLRAAESRVRHAFAEARAEPAGHASTPAPWTLGAGVAREAVRYDGPPIFPLDSALPPTPVHRDGALAYGYAWGERRWKPARTLSAEAGMRVEAGQALPGAGAVRWAPRAAARWQPRPELTVSAAAGRSWHTLQAGPELQEQAITQHLWLLAGSDVPALRSDVATLGAERWLGGGWLASAAGYLRRSRGVAVRDPRPGEVLGRTGFTGGRMEARGAEVAVRRLAGAWTASASYSWGRARVRAEGLSYAAEADQRHAVDLAARVRAPGGVRLGAAFSAATGGAFTRFFGGTATCRPGGQGCAWTELPRAGEPGGLRAPGFASLDLSAEWSGRIRGVTAGVFAQLHNALDRDNPARYHRSIRYERCGYGEPEPGGGCIQDVWGRGLPRLPLAGVRLAF
ncbi:MAG: TonB-dependent receptor domain-containing protein [Longimicrobiaceae bacterium]